MKETNYLLSVATTATATLLLSLLFLSGTTTTAEVVVDENGEAVKTGAYYYVVPEDTINSGGLTMSARNKDDNDRDKKCPTNLHVVQEPMKIGQHLKGSPLQIFIAGDDGEGKDVPVGTTDLNVVFKDQGKYKCNPPKKVWQVAKPRSSGGRYYVTLGPPWAVQERFNAKFKIEKLPKDYTVETYRFKFCPRGGSLCLPVGVVQEWYNFNQQVVLLLKRTSDVDQLPYRFVKAPSSSASSVFDA